MTNSTRSPVSGWYLENPTIHSAGELLGKDSLKKSRCTRGTGGVAESDGDDFLIPGLDQFKDPDTFDATYSSDFNGTTTSTVAEANVDFPCVIQMSPWFGSKPTFATLCWEVVTTFRTR